MEGFADSSLSDPHHDLERARPAAARESNARHGYGLSVRSRRWQSSTVHGHREPQRALARWDSC